MKKTGYKATNQMQFRSWNYKNKRYVTANNRRPKKNNKRNRPQKNADFSEISLHFQLPPKGLKALIIHGVVRERFKQNWKVAWPT